MMEQEHAMAEPSVADVPAQAAENPEAAPDAGGIWSEAECEQVREKIIAEIRTCFDPEIPVNIYDLGLIYEVRVEPARTVYVQMTLTSPACPSIYQLPGEVEDKAKRASGVKECKVEVVWNPTWTKDMMSEAARLQLGLD
jgi:FeS assembly SUF system protein